ncbi:MAG TPA: hypothetical protein VFV86_09810, partial [Nitrososphaeraceae archaeon]|nr:hypothetical protein [Nitrososphaeraceae archaeon]
MLASIFTCRQKCLRFKTCYPYIFIQYGEGNKVSQLIVPASKKVLILAVMSVMVVASMVDTSIVRLSAFTGGLAHIWNLIAFSILVLIYSVGQYVILNFIKKSIEISKIKPVNTIHKIVSIIQWIIISLLVIIISQMIFTSSYSLLLLKIIVLISSGLSIVLLAFLSKKFFVWFRLSRDIVVISYAIAILILTVNVFFMVVYVIDMLNSREDDTRYTQSPV